VRLSTVCCIVHQVCNAIVGILGPHYVRMPQGDNLQVAVDQFFQRWQFSQCAGTIDRIHIKIVQPSGLLEQEAVSLDCNASSC